MDTSRHTEFTTIAYESHSMFQMFNVNVERCYCFYFVVVCFLLRMYSNKSSTCNQLDVRSVNKGVGAKTKCYFKLISHTHTHFACAPNRKINRTHWLGDNDFVLLWTLYCCIHCCNEMGIHVRNHYVSTWRLREWQFKNSAQKIYTQAQDTSHSVNRIR